MKLAYCACDKSGNRVTDVIEAPDPPSATDALQRKGLYVIEIAEATEASAPGSSGSRAKSKSGRSGRLKNLAIFTRQLSLLVSSGTPIVEALGALERQVKEGAWREGITSVRMRVEEGASLSEAMEARPEYFDSVYRSLIAAGESSGNLLPMLDRLASLKQRNLRVRNSIIGAMLYPVLLLGIAAVVLGLLIAIVIPKFALLFGTLDVPLPTSTKVLVVLSQVIRSYWWAMLGVFAGTVIALRAWMKTPAGKYTIDKVILRLPKIGSIAKNFAMARITRLLGVLIESHVPVLEALELTEHAAGNALYTELISNTRDIVSRGEPIHSGFLQRDLISPAVCEAIRNGEQSGQLGPLLLNVASFLDDDNEVVLRSLTSILEPVILILMGLFVGLVAISLFLPLFDLTTMVEGGAR